MEIDHLTSEPKSAAAYAHALALRLTRIPFFRTIRILRGRTTKAESHQRPYYQEYRFRNAPTRQDSRGGRISYVTSTEVGKPKLVAGTIHNKPERTSRVIARETARAASESPSEFDGHPSHSSCHHTHAFPKQPNTPRSFSFFRPVGHGVGSRLALDPPRFSTDFCGTGGMTRGFGGPDGGNCCPGTAGRQLAPWPSPRR